MRQEGGDLCPTTFFWYPFLSGLPFLKGEQKMKEGKKERRPFHQIGHNQCTSILAMLEMGCSIQEIAKRLHRHPSTIYREIRRSPISKEGDCVNAKVNIYKTANVKMYNGGHVFSFRSSWNEKKTAPYNVSERRMRHEDVVRVILHVSNRPMAILPLFIRNPYCSRNSP